VEELRAVDVDITSDLSSPSTGSAGTVSASTAELPTLNIVDARKSPPLFQSFQYHSGCC
jgi:hypothetical protein